MKSIPLILFLAYLIYGCGNSRMVENTSYQKLQAENDSLKAWATQHYSEAEQPVFISLTFQKNDAEQAMNFYVDMFDNSEIISVQRWGKGGPAREGTIMQAVFVLNGQKVMVSDSPPIHEWDFTPAASIYVECENEEELERTFSKLSENGAIAMPLGNYGFSQKFGWVIDQFGVSWQVNLH